MSVPHAALKPTVTGARTNAYWWPNQLNLKILQHSQTVNRVRRLFDYAEIQMDLHAVADLHALTTQDWWPPTTYYGSFSSAWLGTPRHVPHRRRSGAGFNTWRFAP
jgi:catalase-peroxidase